MAGNQYKTDPRQIDFLKFFLDKESKTFANALQSGLKAGYSQEYSENLLHLLPKWLSESIADEDIINIAEDNLREFLLEKEGDQRIKADMTKFALKGLAKQKYSERIEQQQSGEVIIKTINYGEQSKDNQ